MVRESYKASADDDETVRKRLKKHNPSRQDKDFKYYACPVCRKSFAVTRGVNWGWSFSKSFNGNSGKLVFCTYSCMRRAERLLGIGVAFGKPLEEANK